MPEIGQTISHYQIMEKLGQGGMGEVFLALDSTLDRKVALKFLPDVFAGDAERLARFGREAKLLASLNHPNIAAIYGLEQIEGKRFLVLEFVEGDTLEQRIVKGPLPIHETLEVGIQIAEGLEAAHEKGIIHRDLKPANVKVTPEGKVKILDFGLARALHDNVLSTDLSHSPTITSEMTRPGVILGTAAYMSPEQAQGKAVDKLADIWALGCVLYECIAGKRPFQGNSQISILMAIIQQLPAPLKTVRADAPPELERIVTRCMQKNPNSRYPSTAELRQALVTCQARLTALGQRSWLSRPWYMIPAVVLLLVLSIAGWRVYQRSARRYWASHEAVAEINRLVDERKYSDAFRVAEEAERLIPQNKVLAALWPRISRAVTVTTTPSGAEIYVREYTNQSSAWRLLGHSPIEGARIPLQYSRWRIVKQGFETIEAADPNPPFGTLAFAPLHFQLPRSGSMPPGMVRVPSGHFQHPLGTFGMSGPLDIGPYWLDKFEVTNRQFKQFLDRGGYQRREYFEKDFSKDGKSLSWEEAVREFVDATGRAGPSTWALGTYPKGQEDFPVSGVSWYEATAYCRAAGKMLPTLFHWSRAAGLQVIDYVVPLSNIGSQSPAAVGSYPGMSPYGSYDMAGNVKEWCLNSTGSQRLILGGAWNEPGYMFGDLDARSPWDRSSVNGFRCTMYDPPESLSAELTGDIRRETRDYSHEQPVSKDSFNIYKGLFSYDRVDLNARQESVDDSAEYWIREKITYDAAYGNERIPAYLFRPKSVPPPYQIIAYFPGASSENIPSSANLNGLGHIEPLVRSGRAVLYPIYQGTYERLIREGTKDPTYLSLDAPVLAKPNAYRDKVIMVAKDLFRSIDYLETRSDIKSDSLAYMGNSLGARMGPIFLALDNRFKAAIFLNGGLHLLPKRFRAPEVDEFNYVPHVKLPLLMINGRYDFLYLLDKAQLPLFRLLATAEQDKRRVLLDRGHSTPFLSNEETREILSWLDRYLGTVK